MARRKKSRALGFLEKRDFDGLGVWAGQTKACLRVLFSLTYDPDPLIRWRAVEGIGRAAAVVAAKDLERVRSFIRGLFWLMNDESGGVGWHAPESVAETCLHVPDIAKEFGHLLASYLREEPFSEGVHAALARLARSNPGLVACNMRALEESMVSENPEIRAWTVSAFKSAGVELSPRIREKIETDKARAWIYNFETGELENPSVKAVFESIR